MQWPIRVRVCEVGSVILGNTGECIYLVSNCGEPDNIMGSMDVCWGLAGGACGVGKSSGSPAPLKQTGHGAYGNLTTPHPKPYSIYLCGTTTLNQAFGT